MHNHRSSSSSSSFLPSLCSLQTFIGLAVILCVYFTFESSISLHEESVPSQQIKTISSNSAFPQPKRLEKEESSSIDEPPPHSYTSKKHSSKKDVKSLPNDEPSFEQNYAQPITTRSEDNKEENLGGLAEYFDISWGDSRGKFYENGSLLTLSLDELCGSGFQSKKEYLFAKIDMHIKLIPNNSAGTVTTFYMSSNETNHDEIDFEFLGNVSGQPYTVHTNVFSQGKGEREQQFYLWFDPTMDFHRYSILWNPYRIVFFVDGIPIREFPNMEDIGVPFPTKQPMRIFSSLWNADDWATQGGKVHIDWSHAPFVASYRNFSSSGSCVWSSGTSSCGSDPDMSDPNYAWLMEKLDSESIEKMESVQKKYMAYDYCLDKWRFHEGRPRECNYRTSYR